MWRASCIATSVIALLASIVTCIAIYGYTRAQARAEASELKLRSFEARIVALKEWHTTACDQRLHTRDTICAQDKRLLRHALDRCVQRVDLAQDLRREPSRLVEVYRDLLRSVSSSASSP